MKLNEFQRALEDLIAQGEMPQENQQELAELAFGFAIGDILEGIAKRFKEPAKKAIREAYANDLSKPCDKTELLLTTDVTIYGKVNNPRETFDKAMFIKEVSVAYGVPSAELHAIAARSVKKGAPPVSITMELNR